MLWPPLSFIKKCTVSHPLSNFPGLRYWPVFWPCSSILVIEKASGVLGGSAFFFTESCLGLTGISFHFKVTPDWVSYLYSNRSTRRNFSFTCCLPKTFTNLTSYFSLVLVWFGLFFICVHSLLCMISKLDQANWPPSKCLTLKLTFPVPKSAYIVYAASANWSHSPF